MKDKIAVWKHAYDSDENSISRAISKVSWDLAAFSCVVEAVRQAPDTKSGGKRLNGMVMDLLAGGFWSSTMQAIRRLVDKTQPLYGRNAVCSLGAIIGDAKAVRPRLTRRVYVTDIAGLPYNYELIRKRRLRFAMEQRAEVFWVPRDLYYEPSEQRHAEFDWLSGATPGNSSDDDVIREEVFDRLEARLATLDGVVEHATLHFAHAASEASRQGRVLDRWGLDDAKSALKEISQVAELVGRWFCFSGVGSVLPTPQFDQFEFMEQPLLQGSTDSLQKVWNDIAEECGRWHAIENDEL
jgi:hypothetical protein